MKEFYILLFCKDRFSTFVESKKLLIEYAAILYADKIKITLSKKAV